MSQVFLSDRRKRELAALPVLFWKVTHALCFDQCGNLHKDVEAAWANGTLGLLRIAIDEAVGGDAKLGDRVCAIIGNAMRPFLGSPLAAVILGAVHIAQMLVNSGRLVLMEGSAFAAGYDELIETCQLQCQDTLDEHADQGEELGLALLAEIQKRGLFADFDVQLLEAAA